MRSRASTAALDSRRDGGEARVHLQPLEAERHRAQRIEAGGQVGQHHLDQPLDQGALDGGVGPALDAHRRGAAPAAQQHVDDRVDHRDVDHHQAVIVPLLGLEHGQHRRQRDRVQVVAEAQRQDVVDADFDVVGGEIAQAGRHDAHQPVEHDLQHRQALVGHQARADDPLDAGAVLAVRRPVVEAEQAVDLGLVEHPRRLRAVALGRRIAAAFDLGAPGGGQIFVRLPALGGAPRGVCRAAHCTSSSVNSTSLTLAGAAATAARAISSSRSR